MTKRFVNIMPMAGEGKRFLDEGIKIPKPLIEINNEPMFLRSAKCMPYADLWIFLVKERFLLNKLIEKKINENFKNNIIIPIKKQTEGQASTCYLAKKYLLKNDHIFISSCDNYFELNKKEFFKKSSTFDAIVITTKSTQIHLENPNLFGWVKNDTNNLIDISCKKQISDNPKKDRIVVGSFFFRGLSPFQKSIESLFAKKNKINNEYYLDAALMEALKLKLKVSEIVVKNYISWGSYKELKNWEAYNQK